MQFPVELEIRDLFQAFGQMAGNAYPNRACNSGEKALLQK